MSSLVFCVFELLLVLFCWHSHSLGEIWFCLGFVDVLRCLVWVFVVVSYEFYLVLPVFWLFSRYMCVCVCVCVCVCTEWVPVIKKPSHEELSLK